MFVAPALPPEAVRVCDSQVEDRALAFPWIFKIDGDAMHARGHLKGNLQIGLRLRSMHHALQDEAGARLGDSKGPHCGEQSTKHHQRNT